MRSWWFTDVTYTKAVRVPDQATALANLRPGVLVLVMPGDKPKSLKMLCPCGCGEVVSMNLMPKAGKAWRIWQERDRTLSLWPSVWLDVGCKSHFILRGNIARVLHGKVPEIREDEINEWWGHSD